MHSLKNKDLILLLLLFLAGEYLEADGATSGWFSSNIAYGKGKYVLFGTTGSDNYVITSTDGKKWDRKKLTSLRNDINLVAFGNGLFVGMSRNDAAVITSEDGINWTTKSSMSSGLWSLSYLHNLFIGVGSDGMIVTSTDGSSWTHCKSGVTSILTSAVYYNGKYMVYGGGSILVSEDGITWTYQKDNYGVSDVSISNGKFYATINWSVGVSSNGIEWNIRSSLKKQVDKILKNDSVSIIIDVNSNMFRSTDDSIWKLVNVDSCLQFQDICPGQDGYVAAGSKGLIAFSNDGENWQSIAVPEFMSSNSIAFGKDRFVSVGNAGILLSSPDGENWTYSKCQSREDLNSVVFGNNIFAAVGKDGTILCSADGITWKTCRNGYDQVFFSVTFGDSIFFASGDYGGAFYSTDGIQWTGRNTPSYEDKFDVAVGNHRIIIVGYGGATYTKNINDDVWQFARFGNSDLKSIVFGNGIFLLPTKDSVYSSLDGKEWTNTNNAVPISNIHFLNGKFIGFTSNGPVVSQDGINWLIDNSIDMRFASVEFTYGQNKYVALQVRNDSPAKTAQNIQTKWGVTSNKVIIARYIDNQITLSIPYMTNDVQDEISLVSLCGKVVRSHITVSNHSVSIGNSSLKSGSYILRIKHNGRYSNQQ